MSESVLESSLVLENLEMLTIAVKNLLKSMYQT